MYSLKHHGSSPVLLLSYVKEMNQDAYEGQSWNTSHNVYDDRKHEENGKKVRKYENENEQENMKETAKRERYKT